jgi:hypothetical protein
MISKCNVKFDIQQIVQKMCQTHLLVVASLNNQHPHPFQPMLLICIIRITISNANEVSIIAMLEPSPVTKFTQNTWDCKCRI